MEPANICKTAEKTFSRLGLSFMFGTLVILLAQFLVGNVVAIWKPEWLKNPTLGLIFSVLPMYVVGMPALIYLVKKIPAAKPEKRNMKAGNFVVAVIMCYAIMYGCNIIGSTITSIISMFKGSQVTNAVASVATSANMAVTCLYMVVCAPIMEEYVFRKLIVDRTRRYGEGTAVVVSGVIFGLFHGNLNQFAYAVVLGMFFAFIYVKTGKLIYTVAIHMIVNFMGTIVSVLALRLNLQGAYSLLVIAGIIAGLVLMIVFRKRFVLETGELPIPKGKRFTTVFLNYGMLVYCLFWIGMMVVQLLQ